MPARKRSRRKRTAQEARQKKAKRVVWLRLKPAARLTPDLHDDGDKDPPKVG